MVLFTIGTQAIEDPPAEKSLYYDESTDYEDDVKDVFGDLFKSKYTLKV